MWDFLKWGYHSWFIVENPTSNWFRGTPILRKPIASILTCRPATPTSPIADSTFSRKNVAFARSNRFLRRWNRSTSRTQVGHGKHCSPWWHQVDENHRWLTMILVSCFHLTTVEKLCMFDQWCWVIFWNSVWPKKIVSWSQEQGLSNASAPKFTAIITSTPWNSKTLHCFPPVGSTLRCFDVSGGLYMPHESHIYNICK